MWLLTKAGSVDGFVAMKKLHFFSETFRWHYTEPQSRSARKEKKHHSKSSSSRERTNSIRVNVTNRIDRSGRSISAPPLFARAIDRDVIGDVTKDRIVVLMRRSPDVQVSKVPTHTHTHCRRRRRRHYDKSCDKWKFLFLPVESPALSWPVRFVCLFVCWALFSCRFLFSFSFCTALAAATVDGSGQRPAATPTTAPGGVGIGGGTRRRRCRWRASVRFAWRH